MNSVMQSYSSFVSGAGLLWNQKTIEATYNAWWMFYHNLFAPAVFTNQLDLLHSCLSVKFCGCYNDLTVLKQRRIGYYGWVEVVEGGRMQSRRQLEFAACVDVSFSKFNTFHLTAQPTAIDFSEKVATIADRFTRHILFEVKTPVAFLSNLERDSVMKAIK